MSKYIENKNAYLRLQQKGGNDQCMEQGCDCRDSRICTCAIEPGLLEHKHKSVRHDLDKLLVEPQLLNILGDMYGPVVQQIACGSNHSLALLSNGHVISWGTDPYGNPMDFVPPAIQGHVIQIAGSDIFSVALLDDKRTIYIWNNTVHDILQGFIKYPLHTWVTQITCGPLNLLIALNIGYIMEWRIDPENEPVKLRVPGELSNIFDKLKLEASEKEYTQRDVKKTLKGIFNERALLDFIGEFNPELNITQITCDFLTSTVLFNNGNVMSWSHGSDTFLRSWRDVTDSVYPYEEIPSSYGRGRFRQITCSETYSLGLLENGTVEGWGTDEYGTISSARKFAEPYDKSFGKKTYIKQIVCGIKYSAVLFNTGIVRTIGPMDMPRNLGRVIQGKATKIVSGHNHILVLLNNGTVAGWRRNDHTRAITISAIPAEIRAE